MSENENISTHTIGEGLIGGITQETTTTEKIDPTKTIKKITYNGTSIPLYNSGLTWYSPVTDGSPSVSLAAISSKTKSFQIPVSAAPATGDIILIMSTSSSVICFYYSINKRWITDNANLTFSGSPVYSNNKLNFICSYTSTVPSKACFITSPNNT